MLYFVVLLVLEGSSLTCFRGLSGDAISASKRVLLLARSVNIAVRTAHAPALCTGAVFEIAYFLSTGSVLHLPLMSMQNQVYFLKKVCIGCNFENGLRYVRASER